MIVRLHYTERKKSIWSSSSCKNHHFIWAVSRFPAKSPNDPPLPRPVCSNPSDFQTPFYGWIWLVRPWLTKPLRTHPFLKEKPCGLFLEASSSTFNSAGLLQYTAERYLKLLDSIQQGCLIFFVVLECKMVEKMMKVKEWNASGFSQLFCTQSSMLLYYILKKCLLIFITENG